MAIEIPSNPPNVSFFNSWAQRLLAGEHVGVFWSYIRAVLPVPDFLPSAPGDAEIQLMGRAQEAPPWAGRALFSGKSAGGSSRT